MEADIKSLEDALAEMHTADGAGQLREALPDYQETAEQEILFRGKYAQARSYGEGERLGRALANAIRTTHPDNTILEIDRSGHTLRDTPDILCTFVAYYEQLYSSTRTTLQTQITI
ncbi:hypothetical protein NDU88_005555 [Pleurodeles waltl]|uniref:Uncharacterized protein n=1 Tax=Pleurodeles waltl TaxID=8319 RepID=A0AAV7TBN5_PLEWA|nr:hypothetical protein NDU88_005555 [Pleurodeles waltl]